MSSLLRHAVVALTTGAVLVPFAVLAAPAAATAGTTTPVGAVVTISTRAIPAFFTPDGDGRDDFWAPVVEATSPATWALTVRDAKTNIVRSQVLPAGARGSFSWDGKKTGVLAADGTYSWTVTATSADGVGGPASIGGTVILRARAVAVTARASTFSSDVTTNGYSAISWSSAALPPYATGYNISYRQVSISSLGRRTYGLTRALLKNTKRRSVRLYVPAGAIYQVLVAVVDHAPIRAVKPTAYAMTASPVDDRAFVYSRGWSGKHSSSSYKGTLTYASGKGRTATRVVYGSSIRLLGTKCKACGSMTVMVDGRKYAVSTYAGSTRWRQKLFATNRLPGRHVIKVTVAGTRGHPGIWLDGVAGTEPVRAVTPKPLARTGVNAVPPGVGAHWAKSLLGHNKVLVADGTNNSTNGKIKMQMWNWGSTGWHRTGNTYYAWGGGKGWGKTRQGDRRSPTGVFGLTDAGGYYRNPGTKLPYQWSPGTYSAVVNGYRVNSYVLSINYNRVAGTPPSSARIPGPSSRGGQIRLHEGHASSSAGCIGVSRAGMRSMLRWADPRAKPVILMGPHTSIIRRR